MPKKKSKKQKQETEMALKEAGYDFDNNTVIQPSRI